MKIYRRTKKKSKSGFSLVELLVSAGLLGFMGVAISTLGINVFKMQKKNILTSETNEFSSSLGYYLKQSCHDEFKGKTFPGSSYQSLVISGYKGFGDSHASSIQTGTLFADKWRVISLRWKNKGLTAQEYKREGDTYQLVVATISLQSEIIQPQDQTKTEPLPPYHVEIPFLIRPGGTIEDCMSLRGLSSQDICTVMGALYDEVTDTCVPDENCFLLTQFVNCTADRGSHPSATPASPCDQLVKPELGGNYYNYYNEGGGTGSCPTNTDMVMSGEVRRKGRQSCGKKCTNTYYATGKIYLCLKCPTGHTP